MNAEKLLYVAPTNCVEIFYGCDMRETEDGHLTWIGYKVAGEETPALEIYLDDPELDLFVAFRDLVKAETDIIFRSA